MPKFEYYIIFKGGGDLGGFIDDETLSELVTAFHKRKPITFNDAYGTRYIGRGQMASLTTKAVKPRKIGI